MFSDKNSHPHRQTVRELFESRDFTVERLDEAENEFSRNKFATDWWTDALYLIRKAA